MNLLRLIVAVSLAALAGLLWMALRTPDSAPAARPASADVKADKTPSEFAIRDVRVFDGEQTIERASVHVRDGRIVAVDDAEVVPAGIAIVEGAGRTLLPGFIDAHVHTWGEARRDALRFGVTTQLDMFSDPGQLAAARSERDAFAATDRADLWSAGFLATAAGGHGTQFGVPVPTLAAPEEATAWVAARKAEGSDWIKLVREDMHVYGSDRALATLDRATAAAVIEAAHAQALQALVHVSALEDARASIEDGADGLVHVFHDAPADEAFVALARERGAFVVPTLAVIAGFSGRGTRLHEDPSVLPWLSAEQRGTLAARFPGPGRPAHLQHALESVRRLHAAGVIILAGTDAPNPNTAHGASMHDELAFLVEAGMIPTEALAAATARTADAFGLADRGRIAPGQRADLVLVEGDPTRDIGATRAIATLWKNGLRVERPKQIAVAPGATGAKLDARRLGDFDATSAEHDGWTPTTDAMAGGNSVVTLAHIDTGANASAGALRVTGEIRDGSPYPWSGVFFAPATVPMQPVDAGALRELVFQARGDGREYAVLLFSGEQPQAIPAQMVFRPGEAWGEVRVVFADVAGFDPRTLRGIAIVAQTPAGVFRFDLDAIEVR